jgi:hypothetical protein
MEHVMPRKTVYVVATCDTKQAELEDVKPLIAVRDIPVVIVDVSTKVGGSGADIPSAAVARQHPDGQQAAFTGDRGQAIAAMAVAPACFLLSRRDIGGVIGLGGSRGTALVAPAMCALPIGSLGAIGWPGAIAWPGAIGWPGADRSRACWRPPYVFNPGDVRAMAEAGADILVAHMGLATGGSIGASTAVTLDDCVERINAIAEAGRRVRPDILLLCHGGPIAQPEDAQYILARCHRPRDSPGRPAWNVCRVKRR